jgi:hypothetical protein
VFGETVAKDENIVDIYSTEDIKVQVEYIIYIVLEYTRSVYEPERHNEVLK